MTSAQNPPVSANPPPVDICGFASGCPMVPVTVKSPPDDVPPPPSMVLLTIVNSPPEDCANAMAVMRMVRIDSVVIIILFNELLPLAQKYSHNTK